jgi:hypothetical protein
VESERNPGWQVNAGDRFAAEVLRGQDDQIGRAAVGVVHEGEYVAVVFGRTGRGGGEHGFAGGGVPAEVVHLGGSVRQIVLEQGVGKRLVGEVAGKGRDNLPDFANHRAVAVPVRPGDDPVVDPREFLRAVVEGLLRGSDAPQLLLQAARRLGPRDAELARETYLEALWAAIRAGRSGGGQTVRQVAEAARAAPPAADPPRAVDLLLDGLAARSAEGYSAGVPTLRRAQCSPPRERR